MLGRRQPIEARSLQKQLRQVEDDDQVAAALRDAVANCVWLLSSLRSYVGKFIDEDDADFLRTAQGVFGDRNADATHTSRTLQTKTCARVVGTLARVCDAHPEILGKFPPQHQERLALRMVEVATFCEIVDNGFALGTAPAVPQPATSSDNVLTPKDAAAIDAELRPTGDAPAIDFADVRDAARAGGRDE